MDKAVIEDMTDAQKEDKRQLALSNLCSMVKSEGALYRPPLIKLSSGDGLAHVVLGCRVEEQEENTLIHVYDCNSPDEDCCITLQKDPNNKGKYIGWFYGSKYRETFGEGSMQGSQHISCLPYQTYLTAWKNREVGTSEDRNIFIASCSAFRANTRKDDYTSQYEIQGMSRYDGQTYTSSGVSMVEQIDAADEVGQEKPGIFYVPEAGYQVQKLGDTKEPISIALVGDALDLSVDTTAERMSVYLSDEKRLQEVSVEARQGDGYEIVLGTNQDGEEHSVKLTGVGTGEDVAINQEDGEILMKNIDGAVLEVDGVQEDYATVTATATSGGSLTQMEKTSVVKGDSLLYGIQPDEGYSIQDVQVDGKSIGAVAEYEFQNLSGQHRIHAVFIQTWSTNGRGSSSGRRFPTGSSSAGGSSYSGNGGSSASGSSTANGSEENRAGSDAASNIISREIPVQQGSRIQTTPQGKSVGQTFSTGIGTGNLSYKILSDKTGERSVALSGIAKGASRVVIPSYVKDTETGMIYKVTKIPKKAFQNQSSLRTLVIGSNVMTIGKKAFQGCKNLSDITVYGSNLIKVGKQAFQGTKKGLLLKVEAKSKKQYKQLKRKMKKAGIQSARYRYRIK